MTMKNCWMACLSLLLVVVFASSLSLHPNPNPNRRSAISNLVSAPTTAFLLTTTTTSSASPAIATAAEDEISTKICTVVVADPDAGIMVGIQLQDVEVAIGDSVQKVVPTVKSVQPDSLASTSGVREGMAVLGKDSASKAESGNIEFRIRNGPYPFVLQFTSQEEAIERINKNIKDAQVRGIGTIFQEDQPPPAVPGLDPYGRLITKTVQKPSATSAQVAKRGDTLEIVYEAHISNNDGPIYDCTAWRGNKPSEFVLGKGFAIPGVDVALDGMRVGEIREIDIPTPLGYGKFGSSVFDVPGDVRLWWKVELVDLVKDKSGGKRKYFEKEII